VVIAVVVIAVVAAVIGMFVMRGYARRRRLEHEHDHLRAVLPFHSMNDKQFEHALASLCRGAGCRDV
jgi:restriction system protein